MITPSKVFDMTSQIYCDNKISVTNIITINDNSKISHLNDITTTESVLREHSNSIVAELCVVGTIPVYQQGNQPSRQAYLEIFDLDAGLNSSVMRTSLAMSKARTHLALLTEVHKWNSMTRVSKIIIGGHKDVSA